ncbi:Stf0 family sulfotransferase [Pararhodobacter sp. CCB-MM2]|uniref:Stf0 family sulfotransferase n=1 Tax=Pararhodobacter sp. CCB-MM2 TaxID=1786003 RepID=UPI001314CA71|nr:Stf0 family sulfotransferase [Pararhodobacter sp. CCB-MM2]
MHTTVQDTSLFSRVVVNKEVKEQFANLAAPKTRYVIIFTPRSGSSWIGDLLRGTGCLGRPGEPFNPAFVPRMAARFMADDLISYVDICMRRQSMKHVFGCEMTWSHMNNTLGGVGKMLELIQPDAIFTLFREDLVSQAVSLSRMAQTRVSHTPIVGESELRNAEKSFFYDPKAIKNAVLSLRWQEEQIEESLLEKGVVPVRLSYESMLETQGRSALEAISNALAITLPDGNLEETEFSKVSGAKSDEFVLQFQEDFPEYSQWILEGRGARLPK